MVFFFDCVELGGGAEHLAEVEDEKAACVPRLEEALHLHVHRVHASRVYVCVFARACVCVFDPVVGA